MAEPKCPECGVVGLQNIVSEGSEEKSKGGDDWFDVVYCSECGHVYGVFNKISHSPSSFNPLR
ncbi:transcriptional regulator [Lysinibacillus sp.]|uniref:transcriptional regulator n=1 Tax=Lysinibacillus sp. TaxID=1869345 RepID=UPI0028A79618|nr:transcriptional regulator [Lysinibacillus sp.]